MNNFDDSRIIEYWLFENNLTASKAGNDLTASAGGVGYESSTPLEGSYSLKLVRASNQWASRTDASLSAGFPTKVGDTTKKLSFAFWLRPDNINTVQSCWIISKYYAGTNGRSWALYYDRTIPTLQLNWGYNNGNNAQGYAIRSLSQGVDYHIGVAIDGINKTALIRLWDGNAETATTYEHTFDYELAITGAKFMVGNIHNEATNADYDGLIDELVIADDLLSALEFDQIRQGVYGITSVKTINSLPIASVKTWNGLTKTNMKTWNGLV